jgi:mannose PTS system EIID component
MTRGSLASIFLRSFFIHATLNFRRMQNLGFVFALVPLLRERKGSSKDEEEMLTRHLQMFNTHPYLSAPLIGSIARMEEDRPDGGDASPIILVKQSLMGPYAAIGDTFFWAAMRPCAGICAAAVAGLGSILAPLAFILIYFPAVMWVRAKGFLEGYRRGKQGIEFIRKLDLPHIAARVQWLSLSVLAGLGAFLSEGEIQVFADTPRPVVAATAGMIILVCWFMVKKGVSQVYILYGAVFIFLIYSSRELLTCWK